MNTTNLFYGFIVAGCLSLFIYATGCSARTREKPRNIIAESENLLKKEVGDSIASIILNARNVEVSCDTTKTVKLKRNERMLVRYLLADSCNYSRYTTVYGKFHSYFKIVFKYSKKAVTALYDFRLHQWQLLDEKGKLLRMQDLKSKEIFRFARLVFPKDINLSEIQKEQKK